MDPQLSSYTPISKREITLAAATAVNFWSGSANIKQILTGYSVSVAAAGTIQIKYGRDASSSVIFEHLLAGSGSVVVSLGTHFEGDRFGTSPGNFYIESGMNGFLAVNASGYEARS